MDEGMIKTKEVYIDGISDYVHRLIDRKDDDLSNIERIYKDRKSAEDLAEKRKKIKRVEDKHRNYAEFLSILHQYEEVVDPEKIRDAAQAQELIRQVRSMTEELIKESSEREKKKALKDYYVVESAFEDETRYFDTNDRVDEITEEVKAKAHECGLNASFIMKYGDKTMDVYINQALATISRAVKTESRLIRSEAKISYRNEMPEPTVSRETEELIEAVEKYEEMMKEGKVSSLIEEGKGFFSTDKTIYTIKDELEVIVNLEKIRSAVAHAKAHLERSSTITAKETIEQLEEYDKKHARLLKEAQEKFKQSGIDKVTEVVKEELEKERVEMFTNNLVTMLERAERCVGKEREELLAQAEEYANAHGISQESFKDSQVKARSNVEEERMEADWVEADKEAAKFKADREAGIRREMIEKAQLEVLAEARKSGYKTQEELRSTNPDPEKVAQQLNEYVEKTAEEIVDKKLAEAKEIEERKNAPVDEVKVVFEQELQQSSGEYILASGKQNTSHVAETERLVEHYKKTVDMTPEERALSTLKLEKRVPEDMTLEKGKDLLFVQQMLEVQKRQEAKVTDAIDKFNAARKDYADFQVKKRSGKLEVVEDNTKTEEEGKGLR